MVLTGSVGSAYAIDPLLGEEQASLDDKGRLLLSKSKRDRLGSSFAMSLNETGVLVIYPGDVFSSLLHHVTTAAGDAKARNDLMRAIGKHSESGLSCDGQGRVVIPSRIRKAAGLESVQKVVVVGAIDRVEVWSQDVYDATDEFQTNHNLERAALFQDLWVKAGVDSSIRL